MTARPTAPPSRRIHSAIALPNLRVLKNGENRGKGYSVRHGMLEAKGEYVLFTDADLSAPIEEADKLLCRASDSYDVAIGSRAMNRRTDRGASIAIPRICRNYLQSPRASLFVASICGHAMRLQSFQRERCQIIFDQQRIERFGFDPELLYLARHHGLNPRKSPCAGRIRRAPK